MDFGLAGKKALVTGGSHGIGLTIARALQAEGCDVAICSRHPCQPQTKGLTYRLLCDVTNEADIGATMRFLVQEWGELHILINNVGGGGSWGRTRPEDTSPEVWKTVYDKNAGAAVQFTTSALPLMRKQRWGRVVTIASLFGREGGGRPWFTMAKASEIALMKCLAMDKDLIRAHITFNSVAPGPVMIEGTGWAQMRDTEQFRLFTATLPLGRLGTPEEVADVVTFLCSERASWINGACVAIDGGEGRAF